MLARIRRVPILAAAMALGLTAASAATAGGAAATAPPPASGTPAFPAHMATAPQISILPNGDRVLVTGSGPAATVMVLDPNGRTTPAVRYVPDAQHVYVIPDSAMAAPAQFVASQYEIPGLEVAVAAPSAIPHYPLYILQINGVDSDGAGASGLTFLNNVDDAHRVFIPPMPLTNGVARIAVPAGHYSATTFYSTFDATGDNITSQHIVVNTDITVADTGVTTVTADERLATVPVLADTPRPTVNDSDLMMFTRTDLTGRVTGLMANSSGPTYVSPTAPAQVGGFTYQLLDWGGSSPAGSTDHRSTDHGSTDPYRYDLMYPPADHIDANQTYPVEASKLATIHNTVDTDPGNTGHQGFYMISFSGPAIGGFGLGHVITTPEHLTSYYSAPLDGVSISAAVAMEPPSRASQYMIFMTDAPAYAGPTVTWRTWGHGPLTPQVGRYQAATWCRACADGGTVVLGVNGNQDSNPDTDGGFSYQNVSHVTVYRDGTQILSQDGYTGAVLNDQSQQPGTYRLVYDEDLTGPPITQSTVTHTDITVPYDPTADAKWTLPADNSCDAQGSSTTACSVLPVLDLNYQLASDDTNTTHGPMASLLLTVGHQSYGATGSQAAATGATVSVSFDKGATWTAASVVPAGQNQFVALWKNGAAKGVTPWLKVTATDALGGSISQTVDNAYTVG
ncbi:hypothetical protein [Catenulispora pinisilvae]|uniref:hypothetical protein n=1 Tax=Catenulispora pinisilvae TaxID=2705253 RepID=UPI001890F63F|nr:hypothetical protein [Catenulispora pinisilvae]